MGKGKKSGQEMIYPSLQLITPLPSPPPPLSNPSTQAMSHACSKVKSVEGYNEFTIRREFHQQKRLKIHTDAGQAAGSTVLNRKVSEHNLFCLRIFLEYLANPSQTCLGHARMTSLTVKDGRRFFDRFFLPSLFPSLIIAVTLLKCSKVMAIKYV